MSRSTNVSSCTEEQYSALDRDPVAVRLGQLEKRIAELESSRDGDRSDSTSSSGSCDVRPRRRRRRRGAAQSSGGCAAGHAASAAPTQPPAAEWAAVAAAASEIEQLKAALAKAEAERDEARAKLAFFETEPQVRTGGGGRQPPTPVLATSPRSASAPPSLPAARVADASERAPPGRGAGAPRNFYPGPMAYHYHPSFFLDPHRGVWCAPGYSMVPYGCPQHFVFPHLVVPSTRGISDGGQRGSRTPNGFSD